MTNIVITGAYGFLGRNLVAALKPRTDCRIYAIGRNTSRRDFEAALSGAHVVVHLAGVNRPSDPSEYASGNAEFTASICDTLRRQERAPKILFSSSIQAESDNAYGSSKRCAEEALVSFGAESGASIRIFRLKNLFGKWCRPNYNSVTATFCHNIAHGLPVNISSPDAEVDLAYVDDVVAAFVAEIDGSIPAAIPSYKIAISDLAGRIRSFHAMRDTLVVPDLSSAFDRALYATYLSYVPVREMTNDLLIRSDARGDLAEFVKSSHFGQIFVSRTRPGITRGNHYHHTKTEKFLVLEGQAVIRMRHVEGGEISEFPVEGRGYTVVNIPPGYTHSITNIGSTELVTLFWSSEIFDPKRPDTFFEEVEPALEASVA